MARPPSDSQPDSSPAPDDVSSSEDVSPPSEPPPPSKIKPALMERINTIELMPGTLIGAHLPPLLEAEAAKRAAQTSEAASSSPQPAPRPATAKKTNDDDASNDPPQAWRSPFETRPAWLIALSNIPLRIWAMAVGGLALGLLLVSAARGCSGKSRIDELEIRVATLEKAVGVNADAGAIASSEPAASSDDAPISNANKPATPAIATTDDPKKQCAVAKLAAYQAWQGAADKARSLAAPAQAKCSSFWTDAKKQACYGAALQSTRTAEAARDASIKGGGAARDAVKKVKDDARNDVIARARTASSAAFDACQDANDL